MHSAAPLTSASAQKKLPEVIDIIRYDPAYYGRALTIEMFYNSTMFGS